MKIEKIKKLKSGKYKLEIDNDKIITYDDVILNNNLLFNKEVDEELFNQLNIETRYYDVYNRVIKYITTKMRSNLEIEKYLTKLNVDETDQKKIIHDLTELGLINDNNYVKAFISDKIHLSNNGRLKIKKELLEHNIDENIIDLELSKYDNEIFIDKIQKIIEKKIKTNKNSIFILKGKLYQELVNLGYEKELIIPCLDNININDNKNIEKEATSIYNKLIKKYSKEETLQKLKSKLYQKGFQMDDINEIIKRIA